jgi:subtilisin family serine protease
MPARRLVVAAASGVALLTVLVSTPASGANNNQANKEAKQEAKQDAKQDAKRQDRTTTTERQKSTSTTRDTTTTTRRTTTTDAPTTTVAKREAAAPTTTEAMTTTEASTTTTTTVDETPSQRYMVVLKKGNRSGTVAADHAKTRKVKVDKVYGHAVRGYAAEIPDNEIDAVKKDKRVDYVEKDKPVEKFAQILPWGVEKVSRVGDNWSSTRPGDGAGAVNQDVYVLDTGIQPNTDLTGGTEFNARGGPNTDCDGHGTHMAGIAAAIDNAAGFVGVAPGARVHGVKVLDCSGKGTDVNVVAGLDWIIANGARPSVITMSFGGPISQTFDAAVRRAVDAGFTVITAAGNEHRDACRLSPAHMGELNGVITVGATTKNDKPAGFSNFGKCVDMWAPGVRVPSFYLDGQAALGTGTSDSAPHVAGAAALYLTGSGSKAPADVEAALKSNAVRIGTARKSILRVSSANF